MDLVVLLSVIISLMTIYKEMESRAKKKGFRYDPMKGVRDHLHSFKPSHLLKHMGICNEHNILKNSKFLEEAGMGNPYKMFRKDAKKIMMDAGIKEEDLDKGLALAKGRGEKIGATMDDFSKKHQDAIKGVALLYKGVGAIMNITVSNITGSRKHSMAGERQVSKVREQAEDYYKNIGDVDQYLDKYKKKVKRKMTLMSDLSSEIEGFTKVKRRKLKESLTPMDDMLFRARRINQLNRVHY